MTDTIKNAALHHVHQALGAKLIPFAGFDMPVRYSSDLDEHHAVRNAIGVFDVMRRPAPEWPAWFMKLRARLSGAVVVIHVALLVAMAGQG